MPELEINGKRYIPWRRICTVAIIGTLQTVAGSIMIRSGFGSSLSIIVVSDIVYVYRAYNSGRLDWIDYFKQKVASIVVTACSFGLSEYKDLGKGISSLLSGEAGILVKEATKESTEAVATQFTSGICLEMIKSRKNLKVLALKFTCVKIGEAVMWEGLYSGLRYLTDLSIDKIKPMIFMEVNQIVKSKFCDVKLKYFLQKMCVLDALNKYINQLYLI